MVRVLVLHWLYFDETDFRGQRFCNRMKVFVKSGGGFRIRVVWLATCCLAQWAKIFIVLGSLSSMRCTSNINQASPCPLVSQISLKFKELVPLVGTGS